MQAFLFAVHEVTQREYKTVMNMNPSYFPLLPQVVPKAEFPVEQVSWYDAIEFCNRLSELDGYAACCRLSEWCVAVPGSLVRQVAALPVVWT